MLTVAARWGASLAAPIERTGNASYVQRRSNSDGGRTLSWNSDTMGGAEISNALKQQQQASRNKFGRDPRPGNPLFFEPGTDSPQGISEETLLRMDSLIDKAVAAVEMY